MALTSTVCRFQIELADADRRRAGARSWSDRDASGAESRSDGGVYETLDLRVAQHPSENERFLVARVVARCLEHAEGVEFSRGLCVDDEPALWQRDLRGDFLAWIEIGSPSVERLHRAAKTGARVVVYGWRGCAELAAEAAARPIHRHGELEVYALEQRFLDAVAETVGKQNRWALSRSGGTLYLTVAGDAGERLFEGRVERVG